MPFVWSSNPNEQPSSGNTSPDYTPSPKVNYDDVEMKFQLSFKTKFAEFFMGTCRSFGWLTLRFRNGSYIMQNYLDLFGN